MHRIASSTCRFAFILLLAAGSVHAGDRQAMIERIISISEEVIPNTEWLESAEWREFFTQLTGPEMSELEDVEFARAFNRAAAGLPFSHYQLWRAPSGGGNGETGLTLTEAEHDTAIFTVDNFSMDESVMAGMVERLRAGNHRHLILDLRENPGGSFPAVVALARFLTREPVDAGVFLTRRWFAEHGRYPTAEEIARIEPLRELELDAFKHELEQTGVLRLVIPGHDEPVFKGALYLLTSRDTGSAAESFVDAVARLPGRAMVIGETTDGAMLSGERFPVSEDWVLFLPVADYMTGDGRRIDGVGVTPHVEVPAEQALDKAMEMIAERVANAGG